MKILLTLFVLLFSSGVFSQDYITKKNQNYITKKDHAKDIFNEEGNYITKKENNSNSSKEVADEGQNRIDDLYSFTLNVALGTILHEIAHALIDKFDISIFNNEENVADSFLTYYLINLPTDFDDNDIYEKISAMDHRVLMDTADYYYFNILLGKDNDKDFSSHSTDNRRFFNILCNMKDGNPDFFEEYLLKRDIGYLIDDNCSLEFSSMRNAWNQYISDYWIKEKKIYNQFDISFEDYSGSVLGKIFPEKFKNYFYDTYGIEYFEYFQIKLPSLINITFKSCGKTNAFYYSNNSEILICYELLEEYFLTRFQILELKESL